MMRFGLEETDIKKIQAVFAAFPDVEKAILYGSRAKGNFKPASDIDLTLTGKNLNLSITNAIATELDDLLLPYTIDLSVFHQISNNDLTEHINCVGQVFYEKIVDKNSITFENQLHLNRVISTTHLLSPIFFPAILSIQQLLLS